MTTSQYILSIDLGTGGPKVALVAADGTIAASAIRPVTTIQLGPDAAEQDPEEVWNAIVTAAQQVVREADKPADSILAVSCTSQYFSIVPIDEQGKPVGNMIPWMDGRGSPYAQAIYASHPETPTRWIELAGMPPLPSGNDSLSHMLFLKNERPEIYERAAKLVEPADYVTARLTGTCVSNPCTAFAQLLTDNRRLDSVAYHEDLIRMSGIDRKKLPELVPVGSCIGTVRKGIAEEIGLSADTKVFAAVNDTHAAAIGTGVYRKGHGAINIGTTCQVLAFVGEMKTDLENWILSMPSPVADQYMVMSEVGPQSPRANTSMRGGFLNISLETTRAHMLRAVLEGVTFSLRWVLPAVERFIDDQFDSLVFSGGGAVSDEWAQIMADVMNRPVHQLAEPRFVNNRGTAFLAFNELGVASLSEVDKVCKIGKTYQPEPENRDIYDSLFEQFVAAWDQNRPIFEALNG